MKILFLIGILISGSSFAATEYCVGQIRAAKNVDSLWGAFSYDFWCSNGSFKKFIDYGCYSDHCIEQSRQAFDRNEIASLGYGPLRAIKLDSFQKKIFLYTNDPHADPSIYDFAHKVTRHMGFGDRTTVYVSNNRKNSEVNFGESDSTGYINFLFKDHTLVKKISRDTPRMQLSELYIYKKH